MGFFSKSELNKISSVKVDVENLESNCNQCNLFKNCKHPKIEVSGEGRKEILIIGDSSTETEDEFGVAFIGESGELLQQKLRFLDISLNKDCWKINALRCKGPADIKKAANLTLECSPHLEKLIFQLKPKLILAMGTLAITALFGKDFSDRDVERWRRFPIPDEKFNCLIIPLFHPSKLVKEPKNKNLKCLFDRDIEHAVSFINSPEIKRQNFNEYVTIIKDFIKVKSVLNRILLKKPKIAYDYETTGLKPFREGHSIKSIGIAVTPTKAYSFPYEWKSHWTKNELQEIKELWKRILADTEIKKLGHNTKYEEIWSNHFFGVRHEWHFDTMMASHVRDNRQGANGLKFQTFVRFGVRPYDKDVSHFLKAKNGEFNTIEKAPLNDLLLYNGLDCIFTYQLYEQQIIYLVKRKGLLRAYNFFMLGNKEMATLQINGIHMDSDYYVQAEKDLTQKILDAKTYLNEGREASAFKKKFGRNILLTSNQDLGKLFYEVLGKEPIYTEKGQYKTDRPTLESLNLPFVTKLREMKRYEKAKGTYIGQFSKEICDNKMYPFFSLNIPVSFRSSSDSPNFQNLPKRDKEIKNIVRKGIVPAPGCVISENDFCLVGNTLIETNEGPKTIKKIIERIKTHQVYVYCYNTTEKRIGFSKVINGKKTRLNADLIEILLDNDKKIKCTPDHKFMLRDGSYKEAKDLTVLDSLMPLYKNIKKTQHGDYYSVRLNKFNVPSRYDFDQEHRILAHDIFNINFGKEKDSLITHHIDGNGLNNKVENLKFITRKEHFSIHSKQGWKNHPNRESWTKTKEGQERISKQNLERNINWSTEKWKNFGKKISEGIKNNGGLFGKNNPMFGKIQSEESKKRISDAKRGLIPKKTHETCQICSKVYKGKVPSKHLLVKHGISLDNYRKTYGYNHKIKSIKKCENEDTYNITVEKYHNFALSAGVIVKNSGAEVITSATCHKDKNFINYLRDKSTDMHRDVCCDLLLLPINMMVNSKFTKEQKSLASDLRFYAKNNWTFAQFYGDWYGSCAPLFWEHVIEAGLKLPNGMSCRDWLETKGIYELGEIVKGHPTPGSFMEHCKGVEEKMWNVRFPEYAQWKIDINEFYQNYGYIENHFGFRFVGLMNKNQCSNFPIQSASFHLLLYTLIQVSKMIERLGLKTKMIGQIHDSCLANVPKDEVQIYHYEVNQIITNLHKTFDWLIIPMEAEVEISKLREDGGNFAELEKMKDPNNVNLDWY